MKEREKGGERKERDSDGARERERVNEKDRGQYAGRERGGKDRVGEIWR